MRVRDGHTVATISIQFLSSLSKPFLIAIGLALVAVVAVFDFSTGPELVFSVFYLLPIFFSTWVLGQWPGVLASITCSLLLFFQDAIAARTYAHPFIPYWNVSVEFGVFLVVTLALSSLRNALEQEKNAIQDRIRRDIEIAQEVQSYLFPRVLPCVKTLEYDGVCKAARGISGDYYDFFALGPTKLGIVVGDVSGKGISAA